MSARKRSRNRRETALFDAGIAVLVVGLALALRVFLSADDAPEDLASVIAASKLYQHNLQLMGGHFGALLAQFSDWFGSLWHGRALAGTIAVIALALAGTCFIASGIARSSSSGAGRDDE